MKLHQLLAVVVAASVGQICVASEKTSNRPLNGTLAPSTLFRTKAALVAKSLSVLFILPRCATLVFVSRQAPVSADPTVDIFVKRLPATTGTPETATMSGSFKAVQGRRPPTSRLQGSTSTMDHRGTGVVRYLTVLQRKSRLLAPLLEVQLIRPNAASDIAAFIAEYTNGASTIVYGVSYGTVVVDRLIHLNPTNVTGYVLDSVATSSGASGDHFSYISMWDAEVGEVGDHCLELCSQDSVCSTHFNSTNLLTTLQNVLVEFDNNPNSSCATLVSNKTETSPPPAGVRLTLGSLLKDADTRTLSALPLGLELSVGNYDGNGFIYERDQFWNESATVSSEASVLLLNGKLDPQTPYKYAEYLFNALDSSRKELIAFDYATHGITVSTPIVKSDGTVVYCGMELCVDLVPAFNLTVSIESMNRYLGTDDAYDGIYNNNTSK
ncbi:unnamed protein product [Phytophthora lilii]|uniref:Unnamed protein product n=1 Tax=Phytophthora lilii TaxID=2077276 RepID=A0A9W6TRY0_9STRA|nr:unnamed protein product [Phytophthora lilii]